MNPHATAFVPGGYASLGLRENNLGSPLLTVIYPKNRYCIFYVYVPKTNPKSQWETIPKVKTFLMGVFRWARGQFHSQRHVVCFAMQRPRQIVPCGSLVDGPGLPTAPSGLNGGGLFCVAALHD